jgi:hypothetical protein
MDRSGVDVARLAQAIVFVDGGPHGPVERRDAYRQAQELYRALEDGTLSEESLARAIHGAQCSGTRGERFHEWPDHRGRATDLLCAVDDAELDHKLAERAREAYGTDADADGT